MMLGPRDRQGETSAAEFWGKQQNMLVQMFCPYRFCPARAFADAFPYTDTHTDTHTAVGLVSWQKLRPPAQDEFDRGAAWDAAAFDADDSDSPDRDISGAWCPR